MRAKSVIFLALILALGLSACVDDADITKASTSAVKITESTEDIREEDYKPVIYLYPEELTKVSVELDYRGELTLTYPSYNEGWQVMAYPDGTLINQADQAEYSYLFWEGKSAVVYDFSSGFVVKGQDTERFLKEKLQFLGLTAREYNEFIVFWLPHMIDNPYNLISFQEEAYTENANLKISPKPDSLLRVFMAFKALEEELEIPEQELATFSRQGFTVVEWGGCLVKH